MYILFIERQRRTVADMLDHITGTAELIRDSFAVYEHLVDERFCRIKRSKIPNFRDNESVKEDQSAMQFGLDKLQTIAIYSYG